MLTSLPSFWKKQQKDWKVTVYRTSLERLGYKMIYPYLSLFIISLGADKTQLGLMNSLGMLLVAIAGPITGQILDNHGPKRVYIVGIIMLFFSYMTYALSWDWRWCILAMCLYYLGFGISIHSCSTICGTCLLNRDRARGMLVCESLAAGLLGMFGPQIGAFILKNVIGVPETGATAAQYRYLFLAPAFFTLLSLLLIIRSLSNGQACPNKKISLRVGWNLLKTNKYTRKWIVISAVQRLPQAMILPFVTVFAQEEKMAGPELLATMVTVSALSSVLLAFPIGVLADRFGRKKMLYILYPLYWLAIILLLVARSPWVIVVSGFFQGFNDISGPLSSAVQRELVEPEVMGTWIGTTNLTNNVICAVMALVAGMIYDRISPIAVFLIFIGLDLLVRLPLLITIPETLHAEKTGA